MKKYNIKLFRGFENRPNIGTINYVDKNREPSDTSIEIHNKANEVFNEKFGIKFRESSVFCTGDLNEAREYGDVAIIEPLGDYIICWSPSCKDFYHDTFDLETNEIENFIFTSNYQTCDIEKAILSCNEIMIHCKEYKIIEHIDNLYV